MGDPISTLHCGSDRIEQTPSGMQVSAKGISSPSMASGKSICVQLTCQGGCIDADARHFSGLGHLGLQFSRAMGFRTVALSSSNDKRELAMQLCADVYVDGAKEDQGAALARMGGTKVIACTAPSAEAIRGLLKGLAPGRQLFILAIAPETSIPGWYVHFPPVLDIGEWLTVGGQAPSLRSGGPLSAGPRGLRKTARTHCRLPL